MNTNETQNTAKNGRAPEEPLKTRRKLLAWLVAGINFVVGAVVIGPVMGFVASPLGRKSKARWVPLLDDSELAEGQTKEVSFVLNVKDGYAKVDRKYTVYLHRFPDRVVAFDPTCTHLGCRVKWIEGKERYYCPCHGGVFSEDGNVISGPPPKGLDEHPIKVEKGKIWVQRMV